MNNIGELINKVMTDDTLKTVNTYGVYCTLFLSRERLTEGEKLREYLMHLNRTYNEYKESVMWNHTPNNWRKMHKLPMRRKGA